MVIKSNMTLGNYAKGLEIISVLRNLHASILCLYCHILMNTILIGQIAERL